MIHRPQHTSVAHCETTDIFLGAVKRLYEHYEKPDVFALEKARAKASADR